MASPIQIVLEADNYLAIRDAGGGGDRKDFFAHREREFVQHKAAIKDQLRSISSALLRQSSTRLGVLKVTLQRDAWAKSHRPVKAIFKDDRTPVVGGADIGVMLVEADASVLGEVAAEVDRAENETRLKFDKNKQRDVPNPSIRKSEVGAIEQISLFGPADRRSFAVKDGIRWLSDSRTGGAYIVELFYLPPPKREWDLLSPAKRDLFASFFSGLKKFERGLVLRAVNLKNRAIISIRLDTSDNPPIFHRAPQTSQVRSFADFDGAPERHQALIEFLDNHPLIRRIELPGLIEKSNSPSFKLGDNAQALLPAKSTHSSYPRLGVIDGGISDFLSDWVVDRWDILAEEDADHSHGTFIGGLAALGHHLNNAQVCPDGRPVELVDIAVFPGEASAMPSYYPEGLFQFLDEVETAVGDAKDRHGTRVFNMSLNINQPASPDSYSPFASRLDAISDNQDVVLFLSAGNTTPSNIRAEWSDDPSTALASLAVARNDGLRMPAESARNVCVASLNPPGHGACVPFAPARYSCRGPGLKSGVKPDLAHIGGSGTVHGEVGYGLFSVLPDGSIVSDCGTSYAAPQVAKTAAILENAIEGDVSRETLIALLVHSASLPEPLQNKVLEPIARHMVGFGMPSASEKILEAGDNAITLVFAARIKGGQELNFEFAWPKCLTGPEGQCRGHAKLTLVFSPPLDSNYGSEFVRVNLNAALQQQQADGKWKGKLDAIYLPKQRKGPAIEAELIEHDLKWSTVKVFAKSFPRGVGKSSTWRLSMDYLERAGVTMPKDGVPFTAILTISDPDEAAPVFTDMRQSLQAMGAKLADIRTAARIATRT